MLAKVFSWLSAPLRNDTHRKLSLSRCAGSALTAAEIWVILAHPHVFLAMEWPAAVLLLGLNLILWADIILGKRAAGRVLETLAGRLSPGGAAAGLAAELPAEPVPFPAPRTPGEGGAS